MDILGGVQVLFAQTGSISREYSQARRYFSPSTIMSECGEASAW